MRPKLTLGSDLTNDEKAKRVADWLRALLGMYEKEMNEAGLPPDLHMGINPPPAHELDDISRYDGTAGFSNRPDFIREEDERTGITWHGTT